MVSPPPYRDTPLDASTGPSRLSRSASSSSSSAPQVAKTPKSVRFASEAIAPTNTTPPPSIGTLVETTGLQRSPPSTLFSLDDHAEEEEVRYGNPFASLEPTPGDLGGHPGVRHAYGLKSTPGSREAEYDAASDTFSDDGTADQMDQNARALLSPTSSSRRVRPSPIPSAIRQSMDSFGGNMSELRRNVLEGLGGVGNATGLSALTTENGELPDWLKRGAGVFDATTNMANSILGAGIVGLPYSMKQSGFVAGVVLLVGLAMLTDWTIRLIILNSKLSGRQTYIEIMEHCFGRPGKAAVSLFQLAFAYGGMCAFCVVIGDTIPHVLSSVFPSLAPGASAFSFLASRTFVISACTLLISYPLSLYRDIENLSKASAIALVSMVLIVGTVMLRGPAMPAELKGDPSLRFTIVNPSNLVSSISVISFAFVCHHNSLLIYASLKEPSMDKFSKVTHYSTAIACAALTAMSIAGYWTFEEKTLGNILNNFPEGDVMVNIARLAFGINMFTTFPLEAFVCREVLETYFFASQYTPKLHFIITTSLVCSSLVVSLLTCDLGIVLELTGGLSATALAFIFPAVCFLKLAKEGEGKALKLGIGRGSRRRGGTGGARAGTTRTGRTQSATEAPGRYRPLASVDDGADPLRDNGGASSDADAVTLGDLEQAEGPRTGYNSGQGRSHVRSASNVSYEGDEDEYYEEEEEEEEEESISIADIELPLRPGAAVRTRSSSIVSGSANANANATLSGSPSTLSDAHLPGALSSAALDGSPSSGAGPFVSLSTLLTLSAWTDGEYWYWCYRWWTSTKPIAVLCATFGTLVLSISVVQAFWKLFTGEGRGDGIGGTC